jgi:hypothetical protein
VPDPDHGDQRSPEESTHTTTRPSDPSTELFTRSTKSLDSFDIPPPVGIPQPEPGPDGVVKIALPEDIAQ